GDAKTGDHQTIEPRAPKPRSYCPAPERLPDTHAAFKRLWSCATRLTSRASVTRLQGAMLIYVTFCQAKPTARSLNKQTSKFLNGPHTYRHSRVPGRRRRSESLAHPLSMPRVPHLRHPERPSVLIRRNDIAAVFRAVDERAQSSHNRVLRDLAWVRTGCLAMRFT